MEVTISRLNSATRSVRVTFVHAGVTHIRNVNACIREDGTHDIDATRERVGEVALGVEAKIVLGVIQNEEPAPPEAAPAEPAPEEPVSADPAPAEPAPE